MLTRGERARIKAETALAVEAGGGQVACAEASGRISRHQSFSDFANLQMPEKIIGLDVAAELDRLSGDPRFARLLAGLAGGVFVPLPSGSGRWAIEQMAGQSTKEFGEVMVTLGEALRDGTLDGGERKAAIAEIDEAIVALARLRKLIADDDGEGEQ